MKTEFIHNNISLGCVYDEFIQLPLNYILVINGNIYKVISDSGELKTVNYVESESGRKGTESKFIHKIHLERFNY